MFTPKLSKIAAASALAMGLFSLQTAAAPTYCSDAAPSTSNADGLQTSDLTFNGASSNDCYGVVNANDSLAAINALTWGSSWSLLDGTNLTGAIFDGLSFVLTSDTTKPDGNWLLTVTDTNGTDPANLPTSMDLVFALKASNYYAAYLFTGVMVDGSDGGTYHIAFNNDGGQIAGFSHMDLYGQLAASSSSTSSSSTSSSSTSGQSSGSIPEPGTVSLLGLGLLGQVWLLRQRRRRLQQA